jgi:hypothetical protein
MVAPESDDDRQDVSDSWNAAYLRANRLLEENDLQKGTLLRDALSALHETVTSPVAWLGALIVGIVAALLFHR